MKAWDDWSDDEISSKIMGVLHGDQVENWCLSDCGKYVYDCGPTGDQFYKVDVFDINNWSDMGPLAMRSNISITPPCNNRETEGVATGIEFGKNYVRHHHSFFASNEGATRAAAIVFLMLNGVSPDGK